MVYVALQVLLCHDSTEKSLKHKDLFQLCAMDLQKKYDLRESFIEEIERMTNPKPQYPVTDIK